MLAELQRSRQLLPAFPTYSLFTLDDFEFSAPLLPPEIPLLEKRGILNLDPLHYCKCNSHGYLQSQEHESIQSR